MAQVYKLFSPDRDIKQTRTLLHENIPITGSLVSGTYSDQNIKNFSHGRFQSVYDYPYLSSSANHIFDITAGIAGNSALSGATVNHIEMSEKIQMYNQMCQILVGYDITGSILQLDQDGDLLAGGTKLKECVFLSFSRLLAKDEIKKESVNVTIGTGSYGTAFDGTTHLVRDLNAASEYRVNSPAGEYGILYTGSVAETASAVGLVYYQAGIMVLTASLFESTTFNATQTVDQAFSGSSTQDICDAVRHRVENIQFNNTVELNSSIYFCRIEPDDFNYSSNPTYLSESQIRVKTQATDEPVSYITTVGLYSSDNELLAVAKLSEPLKKTPQNSLILRTRLDF